MVSVVEEGQQHHYLQQLESLIRQLFCTGKKSKRMMIKKQQQFVPILEELNYCLEILKLNKDDDNHSEISRKIDELFIQNATTDALNAHGKRIVAMKIISELWLVLEQS